ncbi:hypothetical protein MUK51_07600 [Sphingobacterium faecium]|jgi:hypothetical protein|uniref:hypothetical protein n=1 Tax=Sphingobacterium faecium TaxID=34087 RepID=UPI0021B6DC66|nr:hypothetical protein [Sphingobacterium faecium]UXD71148.1 hypothetical protein MUK51_07600 [Sphingobacterium faecium]
MKTKTIFDINSKTISNGFKKAFDCLQSSKLKVSANGKVYLQISLLWAIVIGIIFPLALIVLVVLTVFSNLTIAIEQDIKQSNNNHKIIELK